MGTKRLLCLCGRVDTFLALGHFRTNGTTLEVIPGTHNPAAPKVVSNPGVMVRLDQALIPEGSDVSLTDEKVVSTITSLFQTGQVDGALIRHQSDGSSFELVGAIPRNMRSQVALLLPNRNDILVSQYAALGVKQERMVTMVRPGVFENGVKNALNWH